MKIEFDEEKQSNMCWISVNNEHWGRITYDTPTCYRIWQFNSWRGTIYLTKCKSLKNAMQKSLHFII